MYYHSLNFKYLYNHSILNTSVSGCVYITTTKLDANIKIIIYIVNPFQVFFLMKFSKNCEKPITRRLWMPEFIFLFLIYLPGD